jgi:hypothetical protein
MPYRMQSNQGKTRMKLLNIDANAKTVKGQAKGFMTAVLYLAPADTSGFEVCPMATKGCKAACLNTAGRGGMAKGNATFDANGQALPDNAIQRARIARTRWYFTDREAFMLQLVREIEAFKARATKLGLTPCVRLNGTSDIPWERIPCNGLENIMAEFPDVQFYDYTKRHNRKGIPANYHLTYSLAEDNDALALQAYRNGMNVAAVFRHKALPETFNLAGETIAVINGDESDLRFLDDRGIIGLYAKGNAKRDTSGFVRPN